jgi:hypothetical protein
MNSTPVIFFIEYIRTMQGKKNRVKKLKYPWRSQHKARSREAGNRFNSKIRGAIDATNIVPLMI